MSHTIRMEFPYGQPERFREFVWASGGGNELWQLIDEDGEVVDEVEFIAGKPVKSSKEDFDED